MAVPVPHLRTTMTEEEWLSSAYPPTMLHGIEGLASERKLRLFAIQCCRRIWDRITDPRCRAAVEFAERFVEVGVARRRGRPAVENAASRACQEVEGSYNACLNQIDRISVVVDSYVFDAATSTIYPSAWHAALWTSAQAALAIGWEWTRDKNTDPAECNPEGKAAEHQQQALMLRDICGNPFQPPPAISPTILAWDSGTIPKLAQAMYDENTFDRTTVLADALEDAGCPNPDVLTHLRGPGPHVRGCWVVDLLLGKA
jgi:hypothetical protein